LKGHPFSFINKYIYTEFVEFYSASYTDCKLLLLPHIYEIPPQTLCFKPWHVESSKRNSITIITKTHAYVNYLQIFKTRLQAWGFKCSVVLGRAYLILWNVYNYLRGYMA